MHKLRSAHQEAAAKTLIRFSVIVLIAFSGCQDSFTDLGEDSRSDRVVSYPLQLGNRWVYERIAYFHNIRMNDSSSAIPRDTIRSSIIVEVIGYTQLPRQPQTPGDLIPVTVLRQMESEIAPIPHSLQGFQYMTQDSSALYLHGYIAAGTPALPKGNRSPIEFAFHGRIFSSIQEVFIFKAEGPVHPQVDSLIREFPPLTALQFPLAEGNSWTFRPIGRPWRIDKQVGSVHRDNVIGKQISDFDVRWLYDMNGDGKWDDDIRLVDQISNQGLMRRTIELTNVGITNMVDPNPVGLADYTEKITVIGLQVAR
jgi:hypothetical protein